MDEAEAQIAHLIETHNADTFEGLRRFSEIVGERDALRAEVESLQAQLAAASLIAQKMATAIGWNTPGEDWVEKAASLKNIKADLAAVRTDLSVARAALEDIASEDYRGPRPSGVTKAAAALVLLAEP